MRICPKCGENFSDVTTFCTACGVALPKTSSKPSPQRTTTTSWNDGKPECETVENESKNESEENESKVNTSQNSKSEGDNSESIANPASDFVYTQSNGQITITQLRNCEMKGVVRVPSQIDHLPVTVIGGTPQEWAAGKVDPLGAFRACNRLTEIILPDSVIQIDDGAFLQCSDLVKITLPNRITRIGSLMFGACYRLRSITIPESVTQIGDSAFLDCTQLTEITIPERVNQIGESAFWDCDSLRSVTIPRGVTQIEYGLFLDCDSLTDVNIPNSVTRIGDMAFAHCGSLTSITIPKSVTQIGNNVFEGCNSLTEIAVSPENPCYQSIDGVLFSKDGSTIYYYPAGRNGAYRIPDHVTTIGNAAFTSCGGLAAITIPDSVTTIGNAAFTSCGGLAAITIPDSVTTIGNAAFIYCRGLTEITIPDHVTMIGTGTFNLCHGLQKVSLPCGIIKIESCAFAGCNSLTEIAVSSENPCYQSIDGVLFSKDGSTIYYYPAGRNGAYRIPDHVTTIGAAAFVYCSGLTEITIPKNVIQIGELAFPEDEHLTIYAQKGSYAWKYAQDRGLQWSEQSPQFELIQPFEPKSLWRRLFKWR